MSSSATRHIGAAIVGSATLVAGGTVGFHYWEHEVWHDAFYRTAVTVTLTGLDSSPRGAGAQFLTIALALAGVAIFGFLLTRAVEAIAREVTADARKEKRLRRMTDQLENHFIICGYGRVGRRAAEELEASGQRYVVLDTGPSAIESAKKHGVLYVEGSGSDDESLQRAGIERARGLLASADSDAENLYITLSARSLHRELMIVARASTREAEGKLLLAGADRVVQPYASAGTEMAKLASKPQVAAFLDLVSSHTGPDLRFEEIVIQGDSPQRGRTIRELRIRSTTGAVVIALRKPDGTFDVTPSPDVAIDTGDVVIAIGTQPELKLLEDLLVPEHAG